MFALSSGSGIFSDIISKVTSIAGSSAAKQLGKSALEGATKGVKAGSEYAAKRGVAAIVNKASGARRSQSEQAAKKSKPEQSKPVNIQYIPTPITNKKQVIDAGTRSILDKLKRGSGRRARPLKERNERSERLSKIGSGIKILN